ncbi:MAG: putative toxin-antitoxin system toxin component, PIN family [Caldilineaceae bacterium]
MTSSTGIVLDTNTIVSALLLPRSISRQAVDHALTVGTVLASQATLDELDDVLRRPKFDRYLHEEERLRFLSAYISTVHILDVTIVLTDCRDAKDNKFLELAMTGAAICIVSGDRDLLELAPYHGIAILSPRDFLQAW